MITTLGVLAMFPAIATPFFFVFWRWFEMWRRHPAAIAAILAAVIVGWTVTLIVLRHDLLAPALAMPWPVRTIGWALGAMSFVLAVVADRQLGLRIRAGLPLFEDDARIQLRTRGAYAVVRHPIYAAGIYYQVAIFLVTGALAIAAACVVLTAGALWFTRQEEKRLVALLEDPSDYDRYRARVGALLPRFHR